MRFATWQSNPLIDGYRGALKVGREVGWYCDHEHATRALATRCAYHAECIARRAGLLPSTPQVKWSDTATWGPKERRRLEKAHYRL